MRVQTKFFVLAVALNVFTISICICSAGMLPYAFDKGKVWFLLGQDRHRGSDWTDFAGAGNSNEQTAAREFHEETMGVFSKTDDDPVKREGEGVEFAKQKIDQRFVVVHPSSGHKTFLVDVSSETECLGGVDEVKSKLEKTLARLTNLHYDGCYTEKSAFEWFEYDEFMKMIDGLGSQKMLLECRQTLKSGLDQLEKLKQNFFSEAK